MVEDEVWNLQNHIELKFTKDVILYGKTTIPQTIVASFLKIYQRDGTDHIFYILENNIDKVNTERFKKNIMNSFFNPSKYTQDMCPVLKPNEANLYRIELEAELANQFLETKVMKVDQFGFKLSSTYVSVYDQEDDAWINPQHIAINPHILCHIRQNILYRIQKEIFRSLK